MKFFHIFAEKKIMKTYGVYEKEGKWVAVIFKNGDGIPLAAFDSHKEALEAGKSYCEKKRRVKPKEKPEMPVGGSKTHGVSWCGPSGCWRAQGRVGGILKHFGNFNTVEEARNAFERGMAPVDPMAQIIPGLDIRYRMSPDGTVWDMTRRVPLRAKYGKVAVITGTGIKKRMSVRKLGRSMVDGGNPDLMEVIKDRGIKVAHIARKLGFKQPTLHGWLNGRVKMPVLAEEAIRKELGL